MGTMCLGSPSPSLGFLNFITRSCLLHWLCWLQYLPIMLTTLAWQQGWLCLTQMNNADWLGNNADYVLFHTCKPCPSHQYTSAILKSTTLNTRESAVHSRRGRPNQVPESSPLPLTTRGCVAVILTQDYLLNLCQLMHWYLTQRSPSSAPSRPRWH